ncbi:MAG: glycosyltransferase family 4 protein [Pseudonocardiaceae bacterium]
MLFVHPGEAFNRIGGARLRWNALAEGMQRVAEVVRFETRCAGGCGGHPTGPAVEDSLGWMPDADPYWFYYCPRTARQLAQLAADGDFSIIVASGLEMTRYLSEIPATAGVKRVIDIKDVESELRLTITRATRDRPQYASWASEEVARQLGQLEVATTGECDAVWTCTEEDRATLVCKYGLRADGIWVLPNAVALPGIADVPRPSRVVCIGKLNYFPVVQAAEFVITRLAPALWARRPSVPVLLAGAAPSDSLVNMARAAGVEIVANPEDMAPYRKGSIQVVPLRLGGGSRLKILEAFASYSPVVSTAKGIEGIPAVPGQDFYLAEEPAEYVDAVVRLLDDPVACTAMTTAARTFVARHNSIEAVESEFVAFLRWLAGDTDASGT